MARKREFDRETVLGQAMLVFWEKGFEATSIGDLTKTMGISTSSMYEAFGDKRGLFLEALARYCETERHQLTERVQQSASALQLVEQLFDSVPTVVQSTDQNHGSFAFNAMVEFGTRDAAVTDLIFTHYFRVGEILAEVLDQAQEAGTITTQHDALPLAHLILSTLHGMITLERAIPDYRYAEPIKQIILSLLTH